MVRTHGFARLSAFVAAAAIMSAVAACPPSEGDFDFEGYDISGDGFVQLPEGARLRVVSKTTSLDAQGKLVVDDRMALVVEDPARKDARVLTMKLTPQVADEVKEWLGSAITTQESWLKETKTIEKAGVECALDAKQCRAIATGKKASLPQMWVWVSSAAGEQGWSMVPAAVPASAPLPAVEKGTSGCQHAAKETPAVADRRITLTAYEYRQGVSQPLMVKMDTQTAKTLLADLGRTLDERNGKVRPAKDESAKPQS